MSEKSLTVNFKILRSERRTTKTNEPYYVLELLDVNGNKHEARLWSDVIAGIKEQHLPQEGQYWGDVKSHENVFKGQKQLVIDDYRALELGKVSETIKEQFTEQPVVEVDRVIARMFDWEFWDYDMYALMQRVREHLEQDGVWEKIKAVPAGASFHHNVRGGFLLHIDEMLSLSEGLCECRETSEGLLVEGPHHYRGMVDYQILRAAIVLHDIGKVYDYDEKTLQYKPNPTSDCLEHTIVGILMVDRYLFKDSPESLDRALRLMHALAAHHGSEMGAVKPKTPEAIILHHLDMISANLDVCRHAYEETKKGNPPEYSRMMRVRPFVPSFFSPDRSVCFRSNEFKEEKASENTESDIKTADKLPWED